MKRYISSRWWLLLGVDVTVECDAQIVFPVTTPNWATGLVAVVVGQVLALRLGEVRGRPIDTSPRLSKVTLSA